MPLTKLKRIDQGTWINYGGGPSARGVCYYMCNFLESDKGIWHKPGTFEAARKAAETFAAGTAMMNYAKAQNSRKAPQIGVYPIVAGALQNNRIYRVGLWFGPTDQVPLAPNHEVILITGEGQDVIYFEPNFGFFQPSQAGLNNREAVEYYINQQYGPDYHAGSFQYYNVRSITSASPLGFNKY